MIWIPTSFHIELTNACVARCPFCIRTKENTQYSSELYHEDIINFFTPELLKSTTDVTLCGTYGDPIYARDIVDIVHYFVSHDVKVHISTN
jgi:MoaA/NifB/PqqE/SkfB family radical SAM enzyme